MTLSLANKHVLLGITGSIAAYKSPDLVRRLREIGAEVRVVMTENAKRFITPLTLQAVSGYPVHDDLFDVHAEAAMGHIELARWADIILIAPATADFMARLSHGHADDLLTTLCLATRAPVALAPAMNQAMWIHPRTQENAALLANQHIKVLGTNQGSQACGDVGPGRMLEPSEIIEKVFPLLLSGELVNCRVLITAGPTHEALDPVRYLTNGSSGKMGYALAQAAQLAGAKVLLVSGPVALKPPAQVKCINVVTAQEMYDAVMRNIDDCDILLGVAAVSDYRSQHVAPQKIKKSTESLKINLAPNPDIVQAVGALKRRPFIVGFAAETEDLEVQARQKREDKKMDIIVGNVVGKDYGMGSDDNEVLVITASQATHFPKLSKHKLAPKLISLIASEFKKSQIGKKK